MSLHIESIGSGPDIVLLHGWAMHSGMWRDVSIIWPAFRLHLWVCGDGFTELNRLGHECKLHAEEWMNAAEYCPKLLVSDVAGRK